MKTETTDDSTWLEVGRAIKPYLIPLQSAQDLRAIFETSLGERSDFEQSPETWNWQEPSIKEAHDAWIGRIIGRKELLLYAQRSYMAEAFPNFDRANPGVWDGHNRPWDYDHLMVASTLKGTWHAKYLRVCRQWPDTIANLHISAFEENRKRGAHGDIPLREAAMHLAEGAREDYQLTRGDVKHDPEKVKRFTRACQQRMVTLYERWQVDLEIDVLLDLNSDKFPEP